MFKRDHHRTDSHFVIVEKDPLSGQITEDHRASHEILAASGSSPSSPRSQSPIRSLMSTQRSSASLNSSSNSSAISSPQVVLQQPSIYSLTSPAATSSAHNLGSKIKEKLAKNLRPPSHLASSSSTFSVSHHSLSNTNLPSPSTPASPSPAIFTPAHSLSPNMALTTTFSASSLSSSSSSSFSSSPSSSSSPHNIFSPSSPGSLASLSLPKHPSAYNPSNSYSSATASTSPNKYSALFHLAPTAAATTAATSSSAQSSPVPTIAISPAKPTSGSKLHEPTKELLELLAVVDPTNERLNRSPNGSSDSQPIQIPDKLDPRKTQLASSIMSSFPSSQSKRETPHVTASNLPPTQPQPLQQPEPLVNQPIKSLPVSVPPELPPRPLSSHNVMPPTDLTFTNNMNNNLDNDYSEDDDNQSYESDADSFTIGDEKRLSVMVMSPGSNTTAAFNDYNPSNYEYSAQQPHLNVPVLVTSPAEPHTPQNSNWPHSTQNSGPELIASSRAHGPLSPSYPSTFPANSQEIAPNTGNIGSGIRTVSAESTASTASNMTSISTVSNISQATYFMNFGAADQQPFQSTPHLVINKSRESVVYPVDDSGPPPALNVPKTRQPLHTSSQDESVATDNTATNSSHPMLPKIDTSTQTDDQNVIWKSYPTDTPVTPNQNYLQYSDLSPDSESSALVNTSSSQNSLENAQAIHQRFYQQLQNTLPSNISHMDDVETRLAAMTTAEPAVTSASASPVNKSPQVVSDTLQHHQQQLYSKTTVPLSLMPRSPALEATLGPTVLTTPSPSTTNATPSSPVPGTSIQQPLYFDPTSLSASELTAQNSNNSSLSLASSGYSYGITPNASKLNIQQAQAQNNFFPPPTRQQMPSNDLIAQYNQELETQELQRLNAIKHQQALSQHGDLEIPTIRVNDTTSSSYSPPQPQLQYSENSREPVPTTPSGPSVKSLSSPPPSAGKENTSSSKHGRHLLGIFKGHKKKTSNTPPASNAHSRDSSAEPPKTRKTSPYEGLIEQPSQEQVEEWEREAENLVLRLPGSDSLQPPPPFPGTTKGLYGSSAHANSDGSLSSDRDLLSPNAANNGSVNSSNNSHHHHHGTGGGNSATKKLSRFSALITGNASANRNRSSSTSSVFSNVSDVSVHDDVNVHLSSNKPSLAVPESNNASSTLMLNHEANVSSSSVNLTFSEDTDAKLHRAIDLHEAGRLSEAAELFRELADPDHTNHPLAQVLYGLSLRHGWGVEVNETLAFQYLRLAGKNSAMLHQIIAETGLSPQDPSLAGASSGGPAAPGSLDDSQPITPISGQYPSDHESSISPILVGSRLRSRALSSAATAAPPAATAAELQSHALKTHPNPSATDQSRSPAADASGASCATPPGTTAPAAAAAASPHRATGGFARGELTLATYELANCFRNGWGCEKDPAAALTYYEAAAHLGDPDAMYEAAWCYLNGFGTKGKKKDKYKAAQYYRMAESKGKHEVGNSWIWKEKYNPK